MIFQTPLNHVESPSLSIIISIFFGFANYGPALLFQCRDFLSNLTGSKKKKGIMKTAQRCRNGWIKDDVSAARRLVRFLFESQFRLEGGTPAPNVTVGWSFLIKFPFHWQVGNSWVGVASSVMRGSNRVFIINLREMWVSSKLKFLDINSFPPILPEVATD